MDLESTDMTGLYLLSIAWVLLFVWKRALDYLNLKSFENPIPNELSALISEDKKKQTYLYQRDQTRFSLLSGSLRLIVTLGVLWAGVFAYLSNWLTGMGFSGLTHFLLFFGIIGFAQMILQVPFSLWSTFVIEERYGFNRTTPKTFVSDLVKGLLVGVILGGILLSIFYVTFNSSPRVGWLAAWALVFLFQLLLLYLAPKVLLPIFNKLTPLSEGDLKEAIMKFAQKEKYPLHGIFTMDGSKRSSKANAFFTGFGKEKRVVLFDTLISNQSVSELLSVLAHEMGHDRLGHIPRQLVIAALSSFLLFAGLQWSIAHPSWLMSFGITEPTFALLALYFSFVLSAVTPWFSPVSLWLSRKHEYEADQYSWEKLHDRDSLISALKKMHVEHLSHPTPHPLYVAFHYTHPPLVRRIQALERLS